MTQAASVEQRRLIGRVNWATFSAQLFEVTREFDKILCAEREVYGATEPFIQILIQVNLDEDFNMVEVNDALERERIRPAVIGTPFVWKNG